LNLKPGDLIQPVKKCMGLKKGEKPVALRGPVRVVSVRREPCGGCSMTSTMGLSNAQEKDSATIRSYRLAFRIRRHGSAPTHRGCTPETTVTRIEFAYEPEAGSTARPGAGA